MLTPHDPETIIGVQMPCDLIELSIDLFELAARTVPEATEMINDTHASLCHRICSLSLACTTPSIDPLNKESIKRQSTMLAAWYGGQEQGNAMARLLQGGVTPEQAAPNRSPQDQLWFYQYAMLRHSWGFPSGHGRLAPH
jgi:hypothetical protein